MPNGISHRSCPPTCRKVFASEKELARSAPALCDSLHHRGIAFGTPDSFIHRTDFRLGGRRAWFVAQATPPSLLEVFINLQASHKARSEHEKQDVVEAPQATKSVDDGHEPGQQREPNCQHRDGRRAAEHQWRVDSFHEGFATVSAKPSGRSLTDGCPATACSAAPRRCNQLRARSGSPARGRKWPRRGRGGAGNGRLSPFWLPLKVAFF